MFPLNQFLKGQVNFMNKNTHQKTKDISKVIIENGDLVILGSIDENGVVHFSSFGAETKALREMKPFMNSLTVLTNIYFQRKALQKNKTYILKFYIGPSGWLSTESFGAFPEILNQKKVG